VTFPAWRAPAILLLSLSFGTAWAEVTPGPNLQKAIQHYKDALAKVRWVPNDGTISGLYLLARSFGPESTKELRAELDAFLATCTPAQAAALKDDLKGLDFGSGRPLPDAGFFLALTQEKKTPESYAFFEVLRRAYPEGPAPACVKAGVFIDLYKRMLDAHMQTLRYRECLTWERSNLAERFTSASCFCGEAKEAEKEFGAFLKRFREEPAAPRVAARLKVLKEHPSEFRFNCR